MIDTTTANCLLAGSLSGMLSVIVCHPMDVIRTKIQASGNTQISYRAITAERLQNAQTVLSLYRGLTGPFIAQSLYKSIIFATNSLSQRHIFNNDNSARSLLISGCISGSVNALVVAPVEIIRSRQILLNQAAAGRGANGSSVPSSSKTLLGAARTVVHEGGVLSLWRALPLTVLRDGPGVGYASDIDYKKYTINLNLHYHISWKLCFLSMQPVSICIQRSKESPCLKPARYLTD